MTPETITAALHNLQAPINEVTGLIRDCAKQPTNAESAADLVKHSIRLAQMEGAFITLQQHAPALVEVSRQYPLPPIPPPRPEEEPEPLTMTEGVSKTYDRVAKIHADTAAASNKEEEE